jgi:hypothetical protein
MKKITMFVGMLLCALAPQVRAADPIHREDRCSNADLRGAYSFVASGTFGTAPFATAGRTIYDGRGNAEGVIQVSVNGGLTPRLDWSGTYTVDPATCTATKTANIPGLGAVDFFVTFGDGFRELRFIATTPGATISGTAKKQ